MPLNSTKDCRTDYVREHLFGVFIRIYTLFFVSLLAGRQGETETLFSTTTAAATTVPFDHISWFNVMFDAQIKKPLAFVSFPESVYVCVRVHYACMRNSQTMRSDEHFYMVLIPCILL